MKQNLVVLTGAGISAESGLKTFRDADGLWEGHDVMTVASPEGWQSNRALVLDFYNQRRRQLKKVQPNSAHLDLVKLEEAYNVSIITQNVDDLHERAGSSNIIHLHGQLKKVRSLNNPNLIYDWENDLVEGDKAEDGAQLRPHIVWFGEEVPMIEKAAAVVATADVLLIVGTSMVVYPAAGLVHFAPQHCPIYLIDPKLPEIQGVSRITGIEATATEGMKQLLDILNEV